MAVFNLDRDLESECLGNVMETSQFIKLITLITSG